MPAIFNARAETVAEKPMFRGAFKYRRCIIPASGFFEWTGEKANRQPHLFTAAYGKPVLAFAGLWDRWIDPDNFDEVISATIIVSGASAWMAPYHDRMPWCCPSTSRRPSSELSIDVEQCRCTCGVS